MLILLPPSETKRAGGARTPLAVGGLSLPTLAPQRETVIDALVALSADEDHAARVLKLGPTQRHEVAANARLRDSATMPAVDRYTGVLYDAVDAASLDGAARRWLAHHVLIHSAPFGPIGAMDRIPAYRLGASASIPGIPALRALWSDAVSAALAEARPDFVLDLRSEAYVALGPVPDSLRSIYVRVVSESSDGVTRALNHFNKHAKGALVRRLAEERPRVASLPALLRWADGAGIVLRPGASGELDLLV
ncbi:YaaA family protein [Microbacterium rhizomatis]|uniref:Peroxide stress protein YaaA n=1 Tax=Microbacterium rhizomatis TaxID=1631477 RepID=A0A5J5J4Z7_9MICO|nr:peroxide stress protein YaaA [Microbacterium rhizomatis]KAA9111112.1 peroxide stress protein YaaA [Microbacterium rhizomatis]